MIVYSFRIPVLAGMFYQSLYLRGKNFAEIHGALSEVCGEFTVDRSTVSRWANLFVVVV